jgi:ABC-2 type transport system permease protein
MSTLAYSFRDSVTMMRRDLRHALRFPLMSVSSIIVPVLFLLLFAGVFGNALHAGLGTAISSGATYIDYLTPGIILMTACASAETTAVNVSTDMTQGIIARFRTMAITRTSVLTGQVIGSGIRTLISGALVVAVALGLGFRPTATPLEWVAATGLFALLTVALTWLTVAFGLVAKTPAGANSMSLLIVVLPFVSSAFVPAGSMPAGVRWFAGNQPFTPVIETLRGLLTGGPIGHSAILAVAWCVGIAAAGYLWARARYDRAQPGTPR